ncbi:hypothetical protein [Xanthomonas arboricola]|uniref:hypothetical protein n=1 Tax=Xanthomonas arboricola TaxID=56448 RepID=UPI000F8F3F14|nr:hypothetical protein [Xanthomonas arboricola]
MQLTDLPSIEREAIRLLLQGNEILCRQLDRVTGAHRTESGAGVYVVFEFDEHVERLENRESFQVADVFATSPDCDEIGFILFVKDGLIEYLESYVYTDVYPSYEECDFSLSRPVKGEDN